MENVVEVNSEQHKHLTLDLSKQEQHGANLRLIPVVVPEFTHVALEYPIVLTKKEDTGEFAFIAMMGFDQAENLYWNNNEWQGLYVPLQVQRQPFFLGRSASSTVKDNYVVCIDMTSPMVETNKVSCNDPQIKDPSNHIHALYDHVGSETPYFQQAKQCLVRILQGEKANEELLFALKQYDLLQPLSLAINFADQSNTRLNGLYTINQEKLSSLAQAHFLTLHKTHLLQPINTMILSLGQIASLIERKNEKLAVVHD